MSAFCSFPKLYEKEKVFLKRFLVCFCHVYLFTLGVYVLCVSVFTAMHMRKSEDSFLELVLVPHRVGSCCTQVVIVSGQCLYSGLPCWPWEGLGGPVMRLCAACPGLRLCGLTVPEPRMSSSGRTCTADMRSLVQSQHQKM